MSMKGFVREHPAFSLCGLNCALCGLHLGGHCPGCGGGEGNQSCALARCGMAHGVAYCTDCPLYPCDRYEGADEEDNSFISTMHRRQDLSRMAAVGETAYLEQLSERAEVYRALEARYNDGRRKTLFRQAVNLLPLEDVRALLPALEAEVRADEDVKSRAARAAACIAKRAEQQGISLKTRKKPAQPSPTPEE